MTTYTAITAGEIDAESPITVDLMTKMRDNPIAITEGASGAPQIQRAAIDEGVLHRWFFDYGDGSDGAITHSASTDIAPGLYQCTTFTIDATYTIGLSKKGPLIICAQTSITINGTLDLDGDGGVGGLANSPNTYGGNGIFGGSGGGASSGARGGNTFLTSGAAATGTGSAQSTNTKNLLLACMPMVLMPAYANRPTDSSGNILYDTHTGDSFVGGAGGGGVTTGTAPGGDGGGLVVLVAPTITVGAAGVITADGTDGTNSTGDGGGGGGGAIIIATPSGGYTNNGSVATPTGGTGPGSAGDGGAGFVQELTL